MTNIMVQLIDDLLNVSNIESGIMSLHMADTNLMTLFSNSLDLLKVIADKKGIELVYEHDPKLPNVYCDPLKTMEVILNLVSNAIKFSKPESTVQIRLKSAGDDVIFSVKDEGLGIPDHVRENLFQPFSKGSKKGTAGEPCTGLGLWIVKKIVTEHGGKVWFESEEGIGTTFFVSLPINAIVEENASKILLSH